MAALPCTPADSTLYQTFHRAELYPTITMGILHLWSPLLLVMAGHLDIVRSVSFSPDGTRILSASDDRTIRIWNSMTGAELLVLQGHEDIVESAKFYPDGRRIVSGSYDMTVRVWDLTTGTEVVPVMKGHESGVASVACSPDGTMVVSGSNDSTVQCWDGITGSALSELRGHSAAVTL